MKLEPGDRRQLLEKLETALFDEEERLLATLPTRIEGQLSGWWVWPEHDEIRLQPPYRPTAAVLPRPGKASSGELLALDLVFLERLWVPMSTAAIYTYAHTEGILNRGETWKFQVFEPERLVFEVSKADAIERTRVAEHYGAAADERARHDHDLVQLRLKRLS